MAKIFEDHFSELQADMVSICLEYVSGKADKIFIYSSCENSTIASDFFYSIDGNIVERHKLNSLNTNGIHYDTSNDRQFAALGIINGNMKKIAELCKLHERENPTEIKLIYDVGKNSLNANYRYDSIHSEDIEKTGTDIAEEWFKELASQSEY